VNKKHKSLDEKLTSTFETKISTTENILRAEIDKKFNELKSHVDKANQGEVSKSDSDVSSLIRQAVKRHMHTKRDDDRGNSDRSRRNKLRRLLDDLDD
jgi:hypothetical protein